MATIPENQNRGTYPKRSATLWPTAPIGLSMAMLLAQPLWIDWLTQLFDVDDATDAARVQAIAAVIQLVFTVTLIVTNVFLAIRNHRMTSATEQMADTARRQMLDSELPVVVLSVWETERVKSEGDQGFLQLNILVEAENGGGPALDVRIHWTQTNEACTCRPIPQPFSLIGGKNRHLMFHVRLMLLSLRQNETPHFKGENGEIFVELGDLKLTYRDVFGRAVSSGAKLTLEKRDAYNHPQLRDTWFSRPQHV